MSDKSQWLRKGRVKRSPTAVRKIALGVCCVGRDQNDILIVVQQKYNNLEKFVK